MKREFLKNLGIEGLTDEVIEKIMKENGADIEAAKAKADKSQEIENLKSELKTTKETLEQANVQIKNFEGLDVESKDKAIKEWETKYSELEANAKAEREANEKKLQEQQYDFKLNEYVNGQKFTSEFAKKAYLAELKAQGFKLDADGNFLGANEYTEKFKAANQGVFAVEEAPTNPTPEVILKGTNNPAPDKGMVFNFTPVRPVPKE